jgi:hypothetical protein
MLSSWRMYEMHLALFLKAGCEIGRHDYQLIGWFGTNHVEPCVSWYPPSILANVLCGRIDTNQPVRHSWL